MQLVQVDLVHAEDLEAPVHLVLRAVPGSAEGLRADVEIPAPSCPEDLADEELAPLVPPRCVDEVDSAVKGEMEGLFPLRHLRSVHGSEAQLGYQHVGFPEPAFS